VFVLRVEHDDNEADTFKHGVGLTCLNWCCNHDWAI